MRKTNSALAKTKSEATSRALVKEEVGLALVKEQPKETRRRNTSIRGIKSTLGKIVSVVNNGQNAIKRGAKSSSEVARSVVTGGQNTAKAGSRAVLRRCIKGMTLGKNTLQRGVGTTLKKAKSVLTGGQDVFRKGCSTIKHIFKERSKKKEAKQQEQKVLFRVFLLITLVVVVVDRDIFFGEHEGYLTAGWLGFCLAWFARDFWVGRGITSKVRLLLFSITAISIIKWLFLLL